MLPSCLCFAALAALVVGCAAEVPSHREPLPPLDQALRDQFDEDVKPLLFSLCDSCHANDGIGPQFMEPDDDYPTVYDQVRNWITVIGQPLVDVNDVGSSYLVRKGAHNGARAFDSVEDSLIRAWLQAEADAANTQDFLRTDALDVDFNLNEIDLGDVGLPELAGTRLRFNYRTNNSLIYVEDLTLIAGDYGVRIEDPLVVPILNGIPVLEPLNRFEGFEADVPAQGEELLDSGLSPYVHLADLYSPSKTLELAFYFRVLRPL